MPTHETCSADAGACKGVPFSPTHENGTPVEVIKAWIGQLLFGRCSGHLAELVGIKRQGASPILTSQVFC